VTPSNNRYQNRYDLAKTNFEYAVSIDPDCADALFGLARLEMQNLNTPGAIQRAEELYRHSVKFNPENGKLICTHGYRSMTPSHAHCQWIYI